MRTAQLLFSLLLLLLIGCGGSDDANTEESVIRSQALLGPVVDASVEIYDAVDLDRGILCTTTTQTADELESAGRFRLPKDCIEASGLYLIRVIGGTDIDADDDGLIDSTPTQVHGQFHAIMSGAQMRSGDAKATAVTEAAYQYSRYLLASGAQQTTIEQSQDTAASYLLKADLNNDGQLNHDDLIFWHPRLNRDQFRPSLERLARVTQAIHANQATSQQAISLFDAIAPSLSDLTEIQQADRVTLNQDLLYVAGGGVLTLVDISNPDHPQMRELVSEDFLGMVTDLKIQGEWLYVKGNLFYRDGAGVALYDISTPDSPTLITRDIYHPEGYDLTQLEIEGQYGYVTLHKIHNPVDYENIWHEFRLDIIDLSNPEQPNLISTLDIDSFGQMIKVQGDRIYLGTGFGPYLEEGGLSVIDISDALHPVQLGRVALRSVEDLVVQGDRGYAITLTPKEGSDKQRLTLLDLSDEANPVVTGTLDTIYDPWERGQLLVIGEIAYLAAPDGVVVVDVSDGSNPRQTNKLSTTASANSLAIADTIAYVAVDGYGLQVFDLSVTEEESVSPAIVGSIDIADVQEMTLADENTLYLLAGLDQHRELARLHHSDSGEIELNRTGDLPDLYQNLNRVNDKLYVTSPFSGVTLFDISDPINITEFLNLDQTWFTSAFAMGVSDQTAVVAGAKLIDQGDSQGLASHRLFVLDLQVAEAPTLLSELTVDYQAADIAIESDLVYVLANNSLISYRLTETNELMEMGSIDFQAEGDPLEIILENNYAYLSHYGGEVTVVAITEPENLQQVATITAIGQLADIHLAKSFLYLAGESGSLQVVDMNNPLEPVFVGYFTTPSQASSVSVFGEQVYVGCHDAIHLSEVPSLDVP